ncbi:phage shock protein A (PspA) family protein [Rhodothalassium salexigens DSM 2132]|uniref:Phage shock protein A (PspA) family protein n=1 Tax=Rhodothalassium salexigens DSM 2132 TaxID=1188247 RepID=A0A4R2PGR1_RHOSA|nr:phage shock protein PspA [Rhodothalassium salexigens]MBB4211661.1 phage shock protein A [Rhodothalassium salexigens DSM 2132]MBK1640033.1 phage shock protein PspA [Rhodothalassium salexigens DSM 2132]TCP34407.1 phage shock protein A (PspA) family protein [Rhodothalassium salexigens DSM 2132]
MGIFSRLTDIINSNITHILDRAEDPEKMIRMVIQEMEDTLVEVRAAAARTIADQKDTQRRLKRMADAQTDWERKAELALSKGREDLARGALMEKARVAEMTDSLEAEVEQLKDALAKHEDDIVKLETKLREAKAKKQTLEARHTTATNAKRVKQSLYDTRIDDAFERFDKLDSRLDRLEGEAEAMDLGRDGRGLADEIADLETESAIEDELAALKARMKQGSGERSGDKSGDRGKGE